MGGRKKDIEGKKKRKGEGGGGGGKSQGNELVYAGDSNIYGEKKYSKEPKGTVYK